MELISSETTLVVAGSWNAAILSPAWMLQYGFERSPGDQSKVKVFMPAVQGGGFDSPKFMFDDLSYIVRPDALLLAPIDSSPDRIAEVEQVASRIVKVLSHTPISGIGHNFEFRDLAPEPRDAAVFTGSRQDLVDQMPAGWSPAGVTIATSFKNDTDTVHVNIQQQWDGGVITMRFNFHHPVTNIERAIAVLEGTDGSMRMTENLAIAQQLIHSIYRRD